MKGRALVKEIAINHAKYDLAGGWSVRRGGRRKRLGIWQPSCPTADRGECGVGEPTPAGYGVNRVETSVLVTVDYGPNPPTHG